jgi:hypothetical protein
LLCQEEPTHPDAQHHRDLRMLLESLDERQRRCLAAIEARRLGYGGLRLAAQITGLDEKTIRRGRRELEQPTLCAAAGRIRRPGAGRKPTEKKRPAPSPP